MVGMKLLTWLNIVTMHPYQGKTVRNYRWFSSIIINTTIIIIIFIIIIIVIFIIIAVIIIFSIIIIIIIIITTIVPDVCIINLRVYLSYKYLSSISYVTTIWRSFSTVYQWEWRVARLSYLIIDFRLWYGNDDNDEYEYDGDKRQW